MKAWKRKKDTNAPDSSTNGSSKEQRTASKTGAKEQAIRDQGD